jgi:C1A family cysteine protease
MAQRTWHSVRSVIGMVGILAIFSFQALAQNHDLPAKYDLREVLGGLNPVDDEAPCGGAFDAAVNAAFEIAIKMKENLVVNLSSAYMDQCNLQDTSCNAQFDAFQASINPGVALSEYIPWDQPADCSKIPVFRKATSWDSVATGNESMPTDTEIKQAIMTSGPVVSAMASTSDFENYAGGVFSQCRNHAPINHVVTIVGWNDDGGYWIIRNTWGIRWGYGGYGELSYGCNEIGTNASVLNYTPPATAAGIK